MARLIATSCRVILVVLIAKEETLLIIRHAHGVLPTRRHSFFERHIDFWKSS